MRRRAFLAVSTPAALSALASQGYAQPVRVFRVAYLNSTSAEIGEVMFATLREALAAHGLVEGRNIVFDVVYADSRLDRVPELARALVARQPDVIISDTTATTLAVVAATGTIPIVMALGNDPVAVGLTESLARPSRNVTGFSNLSEALAPKRFDYLLQVAPRARRVGLLYGDTSGAFVRDATEPIARARGIALVPLLVSETAGVIAALTAAMAPPLQALIVNADPITYPATGDIVEFTVARGVPAIYSLRQMAVDGGLMALSYDPFDNMRGTGDYVARILGGTSVASLPFQQPRHIIFTLNLHTARRASIEVPVALAAVADEVIE
jgi:putative ABC transport system substrate-binding protein